VKQAKNHETKEDVAIKILDKEKIKQEDLGESIKKEISFENLLLLTSSCSSLSAVTLR
jgi:serine/threonine protein kinase